MVKKYRHELKYVVDERTMLICEERLKTLCELDRNAAVDGKYIIRSVYFDDIDNTFFYENENGDDSRYKFRARIYNNSSQYISFEKKSKKSGMTLKESVNISEKMVYYLLSDTIDSKIDFCQKGLLLEFLMMRQMRLMRPAVIVEYERIPFVYAEGNVRITLDRNISGSKDYNNFFHKNMHLYPIMPMGEHVLEIKYDEFLPSFLQKQLNLGNLHRTSYSKYYLCRRCMK